MKTLYTLLVIVLLGLNAGQVNAQQLMNLDAPAGARFTLTEKTWPQNHGQADVCLWNDDKVAATSITIDDNLESQHDFWRRRANAYGLKFTWFVIDEFVSDWNNFQILHDEGHDIQGHDDRNWIEPDDGTNPSDAEYKVIIEQTKNAINSNVTGADCMTYAYPFGDGNEAVAREVFISMRGVFGTMNQANETNYLELNSASTNPTDDTKLADAKHRIDVLLNPDEKLWNVSYYRGWSCVHFHTATDTIRTDDYLSYVSTKADDVWIGGYSEIARYGQSRDTHTLNVTGVTTSEVRFMLTDQMSDVYFNFPLTVKVRVNNTWTDATAVQNGQAVEAQLITHTNGNKYVLVKAVPDAGETTITGTVSAGSNTPPVLDPIGNQTVVEGETLNVNISADDSDGDALVITAMNLPGFASLTDNGDGTAVLALTPGYGEAGVHNGVSIAVSDGTDSHSEGVVITVEESTTGPTIISIIAEKSSVGLYGVDQNGGPLDSVTFDPWLARPATYVGGGHLTDSDGNSTVNNTCTVYSFAVPEIPAGMDIISAKFIINLTYTVSWTSWDDGLYGLPYRNNSSVLLSDYYDGTFDADANATGIMEKLIPAGHSQSGILESDDAASTTLVSYIKEQINSSATPSDYLFFRINPNSLTTNPYGRVEITSSNDPNASDDIKPTLKLFLGSSTSIGDDIENNNRVSLYPNPSANGAFNVNFDGFDGHVDISVVSLQGSVLYSTTVNASVQTVKVNTNIPSGVYIVTISDNKNIAAKKLIIRE